MMNLKQYAHLSAKQQETIRKIIRLIGLEVFEASNFIESPTRGTVIDARTVIKWGPCKTRIRFELFVKWETEKISVWTDPDTVCDESGDRITIKAKKREKVNA